MRLSKLKPPASAHRSGSTHNSSIGGLKIGLKNKFKGKNAPQRNSYNLNDSSVNLQIKSDDGSFIVDKAQPKAVRAPSTTKLRASTARLRTSQRSDAFT